MRQCTHWLSVGRRLPPGPLHSQWRVLVWLVWLASGVATPYARVQNHTQSNIGVGREAPGIGPRFVYCRAHNGFADIMAQFTRCIDYCRRFNRTLVLDHVLYQPSSPLAAGDPYFTVHVPDVTMAHFIPRNRDFSVLPQGYKVYETKEVVEPGPGGRVLTADTGLTVTFDFMKDHVEELLVHSQGGGGWSTPTLRHLAFSDEIKRLFWLRWRTIPKPYLGVHHRNTDIQSNMSTLVTHINGRDGPGRPIFVASDNASDIVHLRAMLGHDRVFSFASIPDGLVTNLHTSDIAPAEKHRVNVDTFVDFLILLFAQDLVLSRGGFSRLIGYVRENPGLSFRLVGDVVPRDNRLTEGHRSTCFLLAHEYVCLDPFSPRGDTWGVVYRDETRS